MKLFTVAEANALLPTVRTILNRIQRAHKKLGFYHEAAKTAAAGAEHGGGGFDDGLRYATLLIELTSQTTELETLGIQLKDFDRGLIDFPSLRDGRVVFNIAGNKYRIIVWINYPYRVVYVRFIGTHAQYDNIDAQTI